MQWLLLPALAIFILTLAYSSSSTSASWTLSTHASSSSNSLGQMSSHWAVDFSDSQRTGTCVDGYLSARFLLVCSASHFDRLTTQRGNHANQTVHCVSLSLCPPPCLWKRKRKRNESRNSLSRFVLAERRGKSSETREEEQRFPVKCTSN